METAEQFWTKVEKTDSCWLWMAGRSGNYGCLSWLGKRAWAHRVAYQIVKGPIPKGLTIDHLCRNTKCVNPNHLEAVTTEKNVLRGESPPAKRARQRVCKRGHLLAGSNVYNPMTRPRTRHCLLCIAERALQRVSAASGGSKYISVDIYEKPPIQR